MDPLSGVRGRGHQLLVFVLVKTFVDEWTTRLEQKEPPPKTAIGEYGKPQRHAKLNHCLNLFPELWMPQQCEKKGHPELTAPQASSFPCLAHPINLPAQCNPLFCAAFTPGKPPKAIPRNSPERTCQEWLSV